MLVKNCEELTRILRHCKGFWEHFEGLDEILLSISSKASVAAAIPSSLLISSFDIRIRVESYNANLDLFNFA